MVDRNLDDLERRGSVSSVVTLQRRNSISPTIPDPNVPSEDVTAVARNKTEVWVKSRVMKDKEKRKVKEEKERKLRERDEKESQVLHLQPFIVGGTQTKHYDKDAGTSVINGKIRYPQEIIYPKWFSACQLLSTLFSNKKE